MGPNGSGKTTILEAISLCCHSKSFHESTDSNLIGKEFQTGSSEAVGNKGNDTFTSEIGSLVSNPGFSVTGFSKEDNGTEFKVTVAFGGSLRAKRITNFSGKVVKPSELIGRLPLVTLSLDDRELTIGSPESRRVYLDRVLCQYSKPYYANLVEYKKVLRQRNSLLAKVKKDLPIDSQQYEVWTEKLKELAVPLILARVALVEELRPIFKQYYSYFAPENENVDIAYQPHFFKEVDSIYENGVNVFHRNQTLLSSQLEKEAEEKRSLEKIRGTTLFGPQRDDLIVTLSGEVARKIASQGQHKSLLIALKFAELQLLLEKSANKPIIILDDIFSELDKIRSEKILGLISDLGSQTFISTADESHLSGMDLTNTCIFDVFKGKAEKRENG
ncbi:MAG: DNA replication and repair protein RecF [Candidatus Kapaibacteriales bacterium]